LKNSLLRICISIDYQKWCFTFGTTIIPFRLSDHTLMRTIPTSLNGTSRSIHLLWHNKWPSQIAYSYDWHKQVNFHC
jgi:hypothetical protein